MATYDESDDRPDNLPHSTAFEADAWNLLFESTEENILWDCDGEMGKAFLSLPPDVAHA